MPGWGLVLSASRLVPMYRFWFSPHDIVLQKTKPNNYFEKTLGLVPSSRRFSRHTRLFFLRPLGLLTAVGLWAPLTPL